MDRGILGLIATVTECCGGRRSGGRGHPPASLVRVLATLRGFLREGTPWRSLRASAEKASGSTLRRCLARWSRTGLLERVHALLVRMLRGHPDLILDSCSVRAKRGWRADRPEPDGPGQEGQQVPCCDHRGWCAGDLRRHRRQRP